MIKIGTVMKTDKEFATVLFSRSSACGENCAGCGACSKKHHTSLVLNKLCAKKSDTVEVLLSDKTTNSALFLIFILPVIIFVLAYSVVFSLTESHATGALISISITIIYAFIIKKNDKKIAPKPEIIRIISSRKDETNGT